MGPRPHLCFFCIQNSDFWIRITSLYGCQTSPVVFLHSKQRLLDQNYKSLWVPVITYGFLHSKQWLQHQKCKSLWVPALIWAFPCKTATLGPEIQVSIGPSPHLWFCAFKTTTLWPELIVSMAPRPHLSFCAIKTAWLAPELLVSKGLSPHLWFLHAKQRLLDQNCKSLWVPALTCGFCIENSDFSTRIASLYGYQTSPVV